MIKFFQFLAWTFGMKRPGTIPAPEKPAPRDEPDAVKCQRLIKQLIAIAESQLGIRETSKNQGPGIRKFWTATSYGTAGYDDRQPWCAAYACWLVREATQIVFPEGDQPYTLPRDAAVVNWVKWAKENKMDVDCITGKVKAGDILLWDFNGPDKPGGTHMGIAVSEEHADGTFVTCEANTNEEGSRDGNGVFRRTARTRHRTIAVLRFNFG